MKRIYVIAATAIVLGLSVASGALAGGSTLQGGYGGEAAAGTAVHPKTSIAAAAAAPVQSGTLPFTGTDLAFAGGAGVLLLGSGFGLRRLGRNRR